MKETGTTVVVIAHRPSLMAHVAKIAIMNEGRIDMFGERKAVLAELQRRAVAAAGQGAADRGAAGQGPQQMQVHALRS